MSVAAGPREVGVTFFKKPSALVEQVREPFPNPRVAGNPGGLAGQQPFVRSVTITGPYGGSGVTETPSRERIFTCRPVDTAAEASCAHQMTAPNGWLPDRRHSTSKQHVHRHDGRSGPGARGAEAAQFAARGKTRQAGSTSNAVTSRFSALTSTPIRWTVRPGARYLSA